MLLQGQGCGDGGEKADRRGDCPAPEGQGSSLWPFPRLSYWLQVFPDAPRLEAPKGVSPDRPENGRDEWETLKLDLLRAG